MASAHQAAGGVQFVKQFVRGKIDRELYGLMIAQLYHLYGSLESALDRHGQHILVPAISPMSCTVDPPCKKTLHFGIQTHQRLV